MSERTNKAERNFIEYANKMMHKEELKPCPFCGAKGEIEHIKALSAWIVQCSNQFCPASYMIGANFETEAEAIEAWNRRADVRN